MNGCRPAPQFGRDAGQTCQTAMPWHVFVCATSTACLRATHTKTPEVIASRTHAHPRLLTISLSALAAHALAATQLIIACLCANGRTSKSRRKCRGACCASNRHGRGADVHGANAELALARYGHGRGADVYAATSSRTCGVITVDSGDSGDCVRGAIRAASASANDSSRRAHLRRAERGGRGSGAVDGAAAAGDREA